MKKYGTNDYIENFGPCTRGIKLASTSVTSPPMQGTQLKALYNVAVFVECFCS